MVKIQKKIGGEGRVWEGQGGCVQRIEVFVKIQKKNIKNSGGGGGRVRVDMDKELKSL